MTREQFLNELKAALTAMEEKEKEAVLSYYAEMIDDRIEAGMSEEAAVMAMEPVPEIAARVLEEAGIGEQPAQEQKTASDENGKVITRSAADVRELIVRAECKKITIVSGDTEEVTLRYNISSNDIFQLHERAEGRDRGYDSGFDPLFGCEIPRQPWRAHRPGRQQLPARQSR